MCEMIEKNTLHFDDVFVFELSQKGNLSAGGDGESVGCSVIHDEHTLEREVHGGIPGKRGGVCRWM